MTNTATGSILVEVGAGELIDKITILKIKLSRIKTPDKLHNIKHELEVLTKACNQHLKPTKELDHLEDELRQVNEALWVIEDDIRTCEAQKDFGSKFIELARSVYFQNDKRAAIKKSINQLYGSSVVEEKSYTDFS
jgi:hypothetical protein